MMETGKMTAVVDLVHTVFLKAVDIEKFIQGDGKMIRDMYVFVILAGFFFFFFQQYKSSRMQIQGFWQ